MRGTQYSILPMLIVDGIMAMNIFPGSVDCEHFLQFLREQVVHTILHSNIVIYSIYFLDTSPQSIPSKAQCGDPQQLFDPP